MNRCGQICGRRCGQTLTPATQTLQTLQQRLQTLQHQINRDQAFAGFAGSTGFETHPTRMRVHAYAHTRAITCAEQMIPANPQTLHPAGRHG